MSRIVLLIISLSPVKLLMHAFRVIYMVLLMIGEEEKNNDRIKSNTE